MRRKEQEVVDDFRAGGALSPDTARSLEDLGLQDSFPVRRLRSRVVVREASPERFYLDEEVWQAWRARRQRIAVIAIVLIIIIAAIAGLRAARL